MAALIAIVSLGQGANAAAKKQIERLGAKLIVVMAVVIALTTGWPIEALRYE